MPWNDTDSAVWRAWLDARRTMVGWCIAYREDGRVCREPVRIVDRQRHGLVCAAHAPAAAAEKVATEERTC
jgi:hypothetical protein